MKAICFILCGVVASGAAFTPLSAATAKSSAVKPAKTAAKAYDEHVVKKGETLWSIAQAHNTSVGEVMDYNHLSNQTVREGVTLKIPHKTEVADKESVRQHIHVVEDGQTFWSVADEYGVSSEALAKANPNVNPNRLHPDMELVIPAEEPGSDAAKKADGAGRSSSPSLSSKAAPTSKAGTYTVAEGETFYSIGKKYGVSSDALATANPSVKPERMRNGTQLVIPSGKAPKQMAALNLDSSTAPVADGAKPTIKPTTTAKPGVLHTVREKESVYSIARMYGVQEEPLMRANRLNSRDTLHPGDILTIPGATKTPASRTTAPSVVARAPEVTPNPAPASKPAASRPSFAPEKPVPSAPVSSVSPAAKGGPVQSYVVSAGENEHTIAEAFGISKQQLFDYNRLDNSTSLRAGDEIMIPARK